MDASAITALLGPTNTGKTHRAIERMLEHASGMIGLPLRLLAREVYDKLSARIGEQAVALVTGEEARVPARPSYWVSTVEAMPVEREVDFVAVDEVQLAASDQRGHVFTSRLLTARGRRETWFLGADTIRRVLAEIVPTARVVDHPRLSRLRHVGQTSLARLLPRSAAVAFSIDHVYALAEELRARKGGAAVVLGALSPKTRNAQIAMFQAGEVDYLVATDAVGMGVNLDCAHVALASLRKFDGRALRPLDDAELGQIAGRAGRWTENGTFGTLAPIDIPLATARAIEDSRFDSLRRVRWRSDRPDFSSTDALEASLDVRPTRAVLRAADKPEDRRALAHLLTRAEIRRLAHGEDRVRLLWDVCSIPDYRKLLFEVHVAFLAEIYVELASRGRLSNDWIAARMRGLDDTSGDVDNLVARIAATRTFSYVANRSGWLDEPADWRAATRHIEEGLSDALHARLILRFVDTKKKRASHRGRSRARSPDLIKAANPAVVDASHPFAKLATLRTHTPYHGPASAPTALPPDWVQAIIDAPFDNLQLEPSGSIALAQSKRRIGMLVRGTTISLPDVKLVDCEDIGAGARSRLQRRLLAFVRDVVGVLFGPVRLVASSAASSTLRGLLHRVEQSLGTIRSLDVFDLVVALTDSDRAWLVDSGLVLGAATTYVPAGLSRRAVIARQALASTFFGIDPALGPSGGGAVSFVPRRATPLPFLAAVGYPVFGPRAIRADIAERAAGRLLATTAPTDGAEIATWVGCTIREAHRVAADLVAGPGPAAASGG